ncbi:MAG: hypothetical protein LCH54_13035 [Bacteroidetes bacterium]|nr:hypothetical protein [Bacteroidota bacterium]MCA0447143.1 hypothetical protein [Bacteroidota bacterium]
MTKMLLPGICLGSLLFILAGCAEPKYLEEGDSINSSSKTKLRPTQGYLLSYQEEVISVKPRIRAGLLGKTSGDYQDAPILTRYEKSQVSGAFDGKGTYRIDQLFIDGTYDGNAFPPSKQGNPGPDEIQKSQNDIDNEIVRVVFDETGITNYARNGKATKYSPSGEEMALRNEWKQKFTLMADSLDLDTLPGIGGKKLELMQAEILKSGGSININDQGLMSIVQKSQDNTSVTHTMMDKKTGNILQDAVFTNGKLDLLTKYNYVLKAGRWFPSVIHSRLFRDDGNGAEVISETVETRTHIKVIAR